VACFFSLLRHSAPSGDFGARRLVSCHSLPYPTRIPAAVKDGGNHDLILDNLIINGEWEPFGGQSMMSETNAMNSAEAGEESISE